MKNSSFCTHLNTCILTCQGVALAETDGMLEMMIMKLRICALIVLMTLSGVVHAEILKWEIKP